MYIGGQGHDFRNPRPLESYVYMYIYIYIYTYVYIYIYRERERDKHKPGISDGQGSGAGCEPAHVCTATHGVGLDISPGPPQAPVSSAVPKATPRIRSRRKRASGSLAPLCPSAQRFPDTRFPRVMPQSTGSPLHKTPRVFWQEELPGGTMRRPRDSNTPEFQGID